MIFFSFSDKIWYRWDNINPPPLRRGELTFFLEAGGNWLVGRNCLLRFENFRGSWLFWEEITPIFFACGDPNPSHGLSVVLQYLNLKKPCLWRAFGAWVLCETVFKRCFHQCRKALILFVNWFTPRADTTFGVFTSVGTRFYYSQNSFHRALTRF